MLKLRKVELLGFKSFADKTEIAFSGSGIAAVVGPNGCGKSNISDAIHWVLGEQSAKTLRSGRMQDVLFNGTPSRKATGLAEVRLTLVDPENPLIAETLRDPSENGSPGTRPAGRAAEEAVITVARRLFASGESEYLLNDRPCRLRDVQELFLGTGLGADSYAIIEQGRIGQILGAKPYERRGLIEEAAGITKFKAKRKLAWAKLESSKQNLARVTDILDEVTKQLGSLQRQAARARRHRELREQMQSQLRQVLASRAYQNEQQLAEATLELGMLRRTLEEQTGQTEQNEREQQSLRQLLEARETELRQAAEERTTLRLEAERARGRITAGSQQVQDFMQRVEESRAEQNQIHLRRDIQQAERAQCAKLAADLQHEKDQLAAELREWEASVRACEQDLGTKEQRREQLGGEMLEAVGRAAALQNQMGQLEQYLAWTQKQMAQVESQVSEFAAAQEAATQRREQAAERGRQKRAEHGSIVARRQELEQSLGSEREQESRNREALEHLRTELAAQKARMNSLEQILAHHAYSTETVQRLLETNGAQAAVHADANGNGTAHSGRFAAGLLADFVDVEPAQERVVEEFLREELEYVVVKDWDSALQGLDLLSGKVAGRATFLLEAAANATPAYSNGNGNGSVQAPAGVRPLSDCVRFTNGFSKTAAALLPKLERCFLVDDAEHGRRLAAEHPELYFLTGEGMWFRGALVSAGKADGQGPLALKRELRRLGSILQENERNAENTAVCLARTVRQVQDHQEELRNLLQQEQDYEKRLMLTERDEQEANADLKRAAERLELLSLELERLKQEAEHSRAQWSTDNYQIAETEKLRSEMEQETHALQSAIAEQKTRREASRQRESELRGRLAAMEERQRSASEALTRLEQAARELTERWNKLESECLRWTAQMEQWEAERRGLQEQVEQGERRCRELELRISAIESGGTEHRVRIQQLEREVQQIRKELEQTHEKKSGAEAQLARLQVERQHVQETCRNELGMELEALAAAFAEQTAAGAPDPAVPAKNVLLSAEDLEQADLQYRELRGKLENLGPINMMALEEFEECRVRRDFLAKQRQDLQDSIRDTTQAIEEIDAICNQQFNEAFEQISAHFQRTFTQLFGGGQGQLRLMQWEDGAEPAGSIGKQEAGVEIVAQPPGKRLQSVLLLSGGEKALTALALLVAIFRYKPSPFCILDEVDAPLDDANVGRFAQMVQEMSSDTQFILITHSKRTMSIAAVMYGVTMQEPGVSKIVSVRFQGSAAYGTETARPAEETPAPTESALAEAVA